MALRDIREIAIFETRRANEDDPVTYDFFANRGEDALEFRLHASVRRPRTTPALNASGILAMMNFQRQLTYISMCLEWHLRSRAITGYHAREGRFKWSADEPASPYEPDGAWNVRSDPRTGASSVDVTYRIARSITDQPPLIVVVDELLMREALPYLSGKHRAVVKYATHSKA